jgi:hypothetical protein
LIISTPFGKTADRVVYQVQAEIEWLSAGRIATV